jgi:hypothetical protein
MSIKADTAPANRLQRVQILVRHDGKVPGPLLKERCDTLIAMLVEADAGVIDRKPASEGVITIHVITRFAGHTTEQAAKAAGELGLSDRATISVVTDKADR